MSCFHALSYQILCLSVCLFFLLYLCLFFCIFSESMGRGSTLSPVCLLYDLEEHGVLLKEMLHRSASDQASPTATLCSDVNQLTNAASSVCLLHLKAQCFPGTIQ